MGAAIVGSGDAGVRTDHAHIELCVGSGDVNLVNDTACGERTESMCERLEADRRRARGDADHICFLDAAVNAAVRILFSETDHANGVDNVAVKVYDGIVLCGHLFHGVRKGLFHLDLFGTKLFNNFVHAINPHFPALRS